METIIAVVFVQSFIWATLLVREPSRNHLSLAVSFMSLFLIYLLLYIHTVFERQIPVNLAPVSILLLTLSISFYQLEKLRLSLIKTAIKPFWLLLAVSVLLGAYCVWTGIQIKLFWRVLVLFGTASFAYDAYAFIIQLKKKNITGSFLEDTPSKLSLLLLLDKFLILLFACLLLFFPLQNEEAYTRMRNSFHILVALLAFVTGYGTVTASFRLETQNKKTYKKNGDNRNNQELIEKVNRLMQDQRPYLDCDLTLEKMADMLELSENELTRLLNHEMDTNFYNLINDYRMQTVLKKLKESNNRKFTIMASAYESGFNSKSTFYRIFKEYTKLTPKEFLADG